MPARGTEEADDSIYQYGCACVFTLIGLPVRQAAAQDNTMGGALLGGAAGAIIGGAATGRAGGAVAGGIIGAARARCSARSSSRGRMAITGTMTVAGFGIAMAAITACPAVIAELARRQANEKGRPCGRPVKTPRGRNLVRVGFVRLPAHVTDIVSSIRHGAADSSIEFFRNVTDVREELSANRDRRITPRPILSRWRR